MSNIHIDPLFSLPVMIPEETFNMNNETKEYIKNLEKEPNTPDDNSNYISTNKYVLNEPELETLSEWLMKFINIYYKDIMKFKDSELYFTQSWVNYTKITQKHHVHNHPNSIVSGVFYLDDDDAKINFYRSDEQFCLSLNISEFNVFNSAKYAYNTKKNGVIIFPSKIRHDVDIQKSDKTRISLAFNTWATGKFGEMYSANLLELKWKN